ncbi:winged helix-turn-helix domain-containing protein [Lutibacter flavus]|uniref:Transcriptional regulatory protein, C terminal n=1 Tax=Lutibacter flavus TaxID=691689 RepID=A0A238VNJ0_9FLAO|nr:winged helix-turn-helix domain-containing protein [Lutibacter flavus]SNR35313.1 Transcriptional regulatory protein, C terminal [Lutibacter flavus]
MLFTVIMSRKTIYALFVLAVIVLFTWMFLNSRDNNEHFSEKVKLSLRDVGNQLLLSNKDSSSLVLPVVALENSKYQLSFQNQLAFEPTNLVSIVKNSFHKSSLPKYYRVEVIQCSDYEVTYSYEIKNETENDIIPCIGRFLPKNCYLIEVRFIENKASVFSEQKLLFILIAIFYILLFVFLYFKRKKGVKLEKDNSTYTSIGSFQFYPEQNKLVKKAREISLSKKECELLEIFVSNPNQIIKRDELTKRVWEDNGVFVGRSLDTYISKLRKKLKEDTTIKLTNIHGVGYKLEIDTGG